MNEGNMPQGYLHPNIAPVVFRQTNKDHIEMAASVPKTPPQPFTRTASALQTSPFDFRVQKPTPMQRIELIDILRKRISKWFMPSSCAVDASNSAPAKVLFTCKQFPAFPAISSTNKSGLFRFVDDVGSDHTFANICVQGLQILVDLTTMLVILRVQDDDQDWHLWTDKKLMPLDRWQVDRTVMMI